MESLLANIEPYRIFIQIGHLFFAIFFIGTVLFRKIILDVFIPKEAKEYLPRVNKAGRIIMLFNVTFLLITGLVLIIPYAKTMHTLATTMDLYLAIKVGLATVVLILFYFMPKILSKFNEPVATYMNNFLHYFILFMMLGIIFCAKFMFA